MDYDFHQKPITINHRITAQTIHKQKLPVNDQEFLLMILTRNEP
jgi:hypothetical protein